MSPTMVKVRIDRWPWPVYCILHLLFGLFIAVDFNCIRWYLSILFSCFLLYLSSLNPTNRLWLARISLSMEMCCRRRFFWLFFILWEGRDLMLLYGPRLLSSQPYLVRLEAILVSCLWFFVGFVFSFLYANIFLFIFLNESSIFFS